MKTIHKILSFKSLVIIFIISFACSAFQTSTKAPPKSRFSSMLITKATIEFWRNKPNFSHFIFQTKLYTSTGGRHHYKLIVYAYDNAGNWLNNTPGQTELLTIAKNGPPTNNREDDIILSNYKMKGEAYDAIVSGMGASYTKLKFNPVEKDGPYTFPNYITYHVFPVDENEVPVDEKKDDENEYLKPSPPAS